MNLFHSTAGKPVSSIHVCHFVIKSFFVASFDEEMLRPFLPLDKVLNGLFGLCSRLFGLGFEEAKNVDCWHPDVRFFHVYEPNHDKPVAGFYFDPYQRYLSTLRMY